MSEPKAGIGSFAGLDALGASTQTLWSQVALAPTHGKLRTILFTGAQHGVGTSTVTACTAAGLARNLRARVLLLEIAAGEKPLASLLGLPEGPGFQELVCGTATLQACLQSCGIESLDVITAGRGALPPGQIASESTRRVFEQLGDGRDFLLIDAPPLGLHPGLAPILHHADEAVLVLEAERTQRAEARELLEVVTRSGVRVLGSVLNRAQPSRFG